jgi:hypothetical protein
MFRCVFTPRDTGTIDIYSRPPPGPPNNTGIVDCLGTEYGLYWSNPTIHVASCAAGDLLNGDVNFDRTVNAADIIYLVGHVFKSGPEPVIWNLGDVNCDGTIVAADIIYLVGYVFKSGSEPCDVCSTL